MATVFFLFAGTAQAGNVTGKASFTGTAPAPQKIDMNADPVCQAAHSEPVFTEEAVVNPDSTLKNVFVYVKEGLEGKTFETPKTPVLMDQKGCHYTPHVFGAQVNQPVEIQNSDSTLHNVHGMPTESKEFNLGMPIQGMKLEKTFFNPEVMLKFKCDVHPWMNAYVGVLPHHFFAVTGEKGTFEITGLPAGEYVLEAWHETYGVMTQTVQVVNADETKEIDFKFNAGQIKDESTGVTIKTGTLKPIKAYDDSEALNLPRKKTGWWLPESISTFSQKIDFLFYLILWITGIVFFAVQITLVFFLVRYRSRPDNKAHYTHGNSTIEIVWTIIPAVILLILAVMGQKVWAEIKTIMPADSKAVQIHIQAEQFAWNIQYAGPDGKFNTPDDIKNINQLHIPVGKPVRATLTSIEKEDKPAVIHSFFLPEFRLKQDVVPGMAIDVWFEANRTGKYEIACAEFCGLGHYRMRGFLTIHSQKGFDEWLKEQAAAV